MARTLRPEQEVGTRPVLLRDHWDSSSHNKKHSHVFKVGGLIDKLAKSDL